MLQIYTKAPAFMLSDEEGVAHKLSDYHGKWVLLYFYPKDNTAGCTKEACMIRDSFPAFKKLRCAVLGVSADIVTTHKTFKEKHKLPFTLLADPERKALEKYGVWAKKKMMGKEYFGILRTSFLINPKGVIVRVYEKVKPAVHAEEVLRDLAVLQKEFARK